MDWKTSLIIKVATSANMELEKEVDADALAFLNNERLQKAYEDDAVGIDELEKIWTEEARAAAAEARARSGEKGAAHAEGEHYVREGVRQGQLDFASYINSKVGMAEGKARAYENKAKAAKGKEQRRFLHISNSYRATAGKLAVSRASFVGVSRMGDVGLK